MQATAKRSPSRWRWLFRMSIPFYARSKETTRTDSYSGASSSKTGASLQQCPSTPMLQERLCWKRFFGDALQESAAPRPPGAPPVARAVRSQGATRTKCDLLFMCLGDEVFAARRVWDWQAVEAGRSMVIFCRNKLQLPDGVEALAAAARLKYLGGDSDEDWLTASDAFLA